MFQLAYQDGLKTIMQLSKVFLFTIKVKLFVISLKYLQKERVESCKVNLNDKQATLEQKP